MFPPQTVRQKERKGVIVNYLHKMVPKVLWDSSNAEPKYQIRLRASGFITVLQRKTQPNATQHNKLQKTNPALNKLSNHHVYC